MIKFCLRFGLYLVLAIGLTGARAGAYEDFFSAVATDNAGTVATLLQRGFDPNSRDEKAQTALYLALREGSSRVAELLLAHADLQPDLANAAGETALMMAALKGRLPAMASLVRRGARIERDGWTPLHYAATGQEPHAVDWLLGQGARVDARSPNGSTALMMAARYGSEAAVELLLARGADARLRNERGMDAADFARSAGRESLAAKVAAAAR